MSGDPFGDAQWRSFERRARTELVPKLQSSAVTISLAPTGETDIKFAVELGLSIMFSKPIIVIAVPGTELPPGLLKVADRVIYDDLSDPRTGAVIAKMVDELAGPDEEATS